MGYVLYSVFEVISCKSHRKVDWEAGGLIKLHHPLLHWRKMNRITLYHSSSTGASDSKVRYGVILFLSPSIKGSKTSLGYLRPKPFPVATTQTHKTTGLNSTEILMSQSPKYWWSQRHLGAFSLLRIVFGLWKLLEPRKECRWNCLWQAHIYDSVSFL